MTGFVGPEVRALLGIVGLVVLGAVASLHLRHTSDDVDHESAVQRRARRSADGDQRST